VLTITGLSKTYASGVRALQDVTLQIDYGLYGLLGPNGAGKSTLMRTLATLQTADAGTVTLDGHDIFADPLAHRRRLGYLPQDFGVYPGIPADDLLDHLALLKGVTRRHDRRAQVEALLHRVNLHSHRRQAVSTYSGGMRRRFGVAQALLGSPRLVIVDEPTAGLDPEERHRFHDLLSEVGEHLTVVLSTHIVDDVRQLCSRMAVLADGRVCLEGHPADLVTRLDGRLWRATVGREDLGRMRAAHSVLSARLSAGRYRVHVVADSRPSPAFDPASPDLEDVYFSVAGTRGQA
jgi:ABC-type multidrug transport system ATPase subunit